MSAFLKIIHQFNFMKFKSWRRAVAAPCDVVKFCRVLKHTMKPIMCHSPSPRAQRGCGGKTPRSGDCLASVNGYLKRNVMPTLSLAMIVKNEAKHLDGCLASVADLVDEIVVVDSGSTDHTAEIAQSYGAKWYSHTDWQGFGKQRQIAQRYVTGDYVLWLDADERLTPELCDEIRRVLQQDVGNIAYRINRLSYAFGEPMRHCWYPDYVLRLYPRDLGQYNDAAVHESVVLADDVLVQTLSGDLLHDTYQSFGQYLRKSNDYSEAWAQSHLDKRVSLFSGCLHAFWSFMRSYVIKRGFLDGKVGLIIAVMSAQYTFNKYVSVWVAQHQKSAPFQ